MISTSAAIVFTTLSALAGLFQIALAFGAPWGEFTLGGRYRGALPRRMRIAAMVSAVLISGLAVIVIARAGLAFVALKPLSSSLIWAVAAYCMLGAFLNFITPSKRERALWFPVVAAMLMCSVLVALR